MKISIITLGCPKNEVDSEILANILLKENYFLTKDVNSADVIIINTCAFITDAVKEAIEVILTVAKLNKRLIVAGCLVNRYGKEKLKKLLPEVEAFFETYEYINILKYLKGENLLKIKRFIYNSSFKRFNEISKYVKISEGCSNACSFCTIPKIKGRQFSRPIKDIIEEIKYLTDNGTEEIILVSQNTGSYGEDLKDGTNLVKLIKEILKISNLKWLKLLYLYPEKITEELLDLTFHEKFNPYLDIPIQHIDDKILKLMNRKTTEKSLRNLFYKIKLNYSHIFLRTSIIVGFPGEDEISFNKLLDFIKEIEFYNLGCFKYSKEEGTKAEKLPNQVPKRIKTERYKLLMKTQKKIMKKINKKLVGKIFNVIIEGYADESNFIYKGRTEFQAPDIDGITYVTGEEIPKVGIYPVKISKFKDYDLIGEKISK